MRLSGKSLIISLLEQRSPRLKLHVFKEARAEIWKIFRLAYVDDQLMPYAVCIQCMKPVAYSKKTTGSLHKHACATAIAKLWTNKKKRKRKIDTSSGPTDGSSCSTFTFGESTNQSSFPTPMSSNFESGSSLAALHALGLQSDLFNDTSTGGDFLNTSFHNINQAINGIKQNSSASSLANLQQLSKSVNDDAFSFQSDLNQSNCNKNSNPFQNTNVTNSMDPSTSSALFKQINDLNAPLYQALCSNGLNPLVVAATVAAATSAAAASQSFKFNQSDPISMDSADKHSRLFDIFIRCLLPIEQTTLDNLNASFQCSLSLIQLQVLIQSSHSLAIEDVKHSLKSARNYYFILDFWTGTTKFDQFVSVWIVYEPKGNVKKYRQILTTKRLNSNWSVDQLQCLVYDVVNQYVDRNQNKLFVLENCPQQFRSLLFLKHSQNTWMECNAHQIQTLFDSILNDRNNPLVQTLNDLESLASLKQLGPLDDCIRLLLEGNWKSNWRLFQQLTRFIVDQWNCIQNLIRTSKSGTIQLHFDFNEFQVLASFLDQLKHAFDCSTQSNGIFDVIGFRYQLQQLTQSILSGYSKGLQNICGHILLWQEAQNLSQQTIHIAAYYLKPESKQSNLFSLQQRTEAQQWIVQQSDLIAGHQEDNRSLTPMNDKNSFSFQTVYDRMLKAYQGDSVSNLNLIMKSTTSANQDLTNGSGSSLMNANELNELKQMLANELQIYFESDLSNENVLNQDFWNVSKRAQDFPNLQLLIKHLCLIETTSYCCPITNQGSTFIAKRLSVCNNEHLDALLFLHTYFVLGQGQGTK